MEKYPNSGQIDGEIIVFKELDQIEDIPNLIHDGMTSDNKCFLIFPLLNCGLCELVKSQRFLYLKYWPQVQDLLNFASRSHKGDSLGYKDDLESLFQVLVYQRNCKLSWYHKPSIGFKKIDVKFIWRNEDIYFQDYGIMPKISFEILQIYVIY